MDSQTSNKRCIYIIVKGKSVKELQKNINEMIEQRLAIGKRTDHQRMGTGGRCNL